MLRIFRHLFKVVTLLRRRRIKPTRMCFNPVSLASANRHPATSTKIIVTITLSHTLLCSFCRQQHLYQFFSNTCLFLVRSKTLVCL